MKTLVFKIAVFALLSPTGLYAGDKPPQYTILKVKTAPKIDGRLDEWSWKNAPSVGAFHFPWYKQGLKEQTDARMLWDDKHLYVSFLCQDAHVSGQAAASSDGRAMRPFGFWPLLENPY